MRALLLQDNAADPLKGSGVIACHLLRLLGLGLKKNEDDSIESTLTMQSYEAILLMPATIVCDRLESLGPLGAEKLNMLCFSAWRE